MATGFGRTGKMFACEHEDVSPDLLCLSKGITGGYMPLAATITTQEIFNEFLGEMADKKTFYHGHSYTANQLACAAGLASLEVFEQENVIANLEPKMSLIAQKIAKINTLKHVGQARQTGMIVGIEVMADKETKTPYEWDQCMGAVICMKAREYGLFIRPVGDVIVFMPPLISTEEELSEMLDIIYKAIDEVTNLGHLTTAGGSAYF